MTWEASRNSSFGQALTLKALFPAHAGLLEEHSLLPTLFSVSRKGRLSETT
jgi:hypothetical protein